MKRLVPWRRLAVAVCLAAGGSLSGPAPSLCQSEISVQFGGSRVSPPTEADGESAGFLVGGLRGSHYALSGSGFLASFLVGRSLESTSGGNFVSGILEGSLLRSLGPGWSAGIEARGFGFRVEDPYPYESLGLEGGPTLRFTNRFLSATLEGVAGLGRSETELQRTGRFQGEPVTDDLWRYGGSGELLVGARTILAGAAFGIHESSGGTFRSAGLRFLAARGDAALEIRVDRWATPLGNEVTGGLALIIPTGGWSLRGFLGRSEPDPLTLTEPDGGSAGLLLGRRLWGADPLPPSRPPLHRVVETYSGGARVQIQVQGPEGVQEMAVVGDFTYWEPVAMERRDSRWIVELDVPAGTHHFGFFADGGWFLPDEAPDAVPDDWGRTNATIVIEP